MKIPRRLIFGLAGFFLIGASLTLGPLILGPDPFRNVQNAALAPPGAVVATVELNDGTRLSGRILKHTDTHLTFDQHPEPKEISRSTITNRRVHRAWLGTDRYGRDLLRLLLRGGRISFFIALLGAAVALSLGLVVGLAAATSGRLVDMVLMRSIDALLAFPSILLLILAASVFDPGPSTLVVLLGLTSWMGLARLVRGQVLSIRERHFILSAKVAGTPWYRVWAWHYLPGIRSPVAQDLALRLGDLVLAEATLSFLGLGLPATSPTWGSLVSDGHRLMLEAWWIATFPGLAIAGLVISCALIGDGLQEMR